MPQLPRGIPIDILRELIKASESGNFGGYNALAWHPNYNPNALSRPVNEHGFPQWEGSRSTGLGSHGAGAYQFEPRLWGEFAPGLGVTDFSPESQDKVATAALNRYGINPWKTNRPLQAAIRNYQQTGAMPPQLVSWPQPQPFASPDLEAGAPQLPQQMAMQQPWQPFNLGFGGLGYG